MDPECFGILQVYRAPCRRVERTTETDRSALFEYGTMGDAPPPGQSGPDDPLHHRPGLAHLVCWLNRQPQDRIGQITKLKRDTRK